MSTFVPGQGYLPLPIHPMLYLGIMIIATVTLTLHAPWARSLKDKRMEVKSLLAKIRGKFNVSAAEVGSQDIHQTITIALAAVAANRTQADSILDHIIQYIEANSEAQIIGVERELR